MSVQKEGSDHGTVRGLSANNYKAFKKQNTMVLKNKKKNATNNFKNKKMPIIK